MKLILIFIPLTIISILKHIYLWIYLGTSYCTGTGTGLNYVYLVCHDSIWLPISIVIDLVLISIVTYTITARIKKRSYKIATFFGAVVLLLALTFFFNPNLFDFWWINITGKSPVA